MNYYEHHIRDYDAATAHLSWDEDMAYTRLLRWYYRKEQPLPVDVKEVCRLIRAVSKVQREAVDAVLREFFELREDGWHHDVCDAAIAKFKAGEPEREAKKQNEATRLNRHREERSRLFVTLNATGQHLPWNVPIAELRAAVERIHNGPGNGTPATPATSPATPATATHTPVPSTHPPPTKEIVSGAAKTPRPVRKCPEGFEVTAEMVAWAATEAPLADIARETPKFKDHEFTKAKSDWSATWRNWMRRADEVAREAHIRNGTQGGAGETPYQRNQRLLVEEATGGLASRAAPGTPKPKETLDVAPAPFALG